MPYGGERSSSEVAKMERCVQKVMAAGRSKSSAIAICKSQILGDRKSSKGKKRGS